MANRRIGYICTILVVYVLRETILRVIYSMSGNYTQVEILTGNS